MATFFGLVVATFIGGIVLPLIAAIAGKPSFDALTFTVGKGIVAYGTFLTALINFVIVGFVMFTVGKAAMRVTPKKEEGATMKTCEFCKSDIAIDATRCPNCTSQLSAASA